MQPQWLVELGREIRTKRDRADLSQGDLAAQAGISRVTLIAYENGDIEKPSINALSGIAKALKTDLIVRGCRLVPNGRVPLPVEGPPPDQLCLEFGKDYIFTTDAIRISPRKDGLLISAIANPKPRSA